MKSLADQFYYDKEYDFEKVKGTWFELDNCVDCYIKDEIAISVFSLFSYDLLKERIMEILDEIIM